MYIKTKIILNKIFYWVKPYLTLRMIPIVLVLWLITNGIWYFIAFVDIGLPKYIVSFSRGYLIFLYTPLALEKPLILFISGIIYKFIYREEFKKKEKKEV